MSNRKHAKAIQGLSHRIWRLYRKVTKHLINLFLRFSLVFQRRGKVSTTGFILPTTVLLILVVALTAGALTFRAFTRNAQVLGEAQQRVIYNAATPAIDRARSKLEFMFDSARDNRLPAGVPSQDVMETMLRNDGKDRSGKDFPVLTLSNGTSSTDPYTLPDERRIDINGDGRADNAWWFQTDTNANGRIDAGDSTIIYSMVLNTPPEERSTNGGVKKIATRLLEMKDKDKANNLFVRQAPLSIQGALGCSTTSSSTNSVGPDGWFEDSTTTAILRKNFQVDALVIPGNKNATKVTLEFNQDRQLNRGNKWGAWFRNDLEIHPGPTFNWNGAMHTEGSLIVGSDSRFTAYLISSPESCLYYPDSSEVTVTLRRPTQTQPDKDIIGLVTSGMVANGNQNGSSTFHLHHPTNPQDSRFWATLNSTTSSSSATNPIDISLDPEQVILKDGYTSRLKTNNSNFVKANKRDLPDFGKNQKLPQRIFNEEQTAPYVDDLYRADDRWGPKPTYDSSPDNLMDASDRIGGQIPESKTKLLQLEPLPGDDEAVGVGLDGYWERRARMIGMRLLVGERLELGNLFTWYAPNDKNNDGYAFSIDNNSNGVIEQSEYEHEGDPLYPPIVKPYPVAPNTGRLTHVDAQRRTLRDNLSAVQSTAIYHSAFANNSSEERDYPVACLATTAHPGTLTTLRQSTTFRPFNFQGTDTNISGSLLTNFFTGVGTNGWEFDPPAGSLSNFRTAITNTNSPLRIALQNLANFAGDYNASTGVGGAYPPTQEAQGSTIVHPYPALSMWGNFSNLKRALALLNNQGNDFNKLSVADKTYLQTAACNIGMLAYNIDQIQRFDPSNPANDTAMVSSSFSGQRLMAKLGRDLWTLMDGTNDQTGSLAPSSVANPEVIPRQQLATYNYGAATTATLSSYNAADYEEVPPEAFIGALRQFLLSAGNMKPDDRDFIDEMRLAELIMLNHQIRRDRTFGFRASPTFGHYAFMVDGNTFRSLPTVCDPDLFAFSSSPVDTLLSANMGTDNRLSTTSTTTTGLAIPTPDGTNLATVSASPTSTTRSALARYRMGLSRLCGTIDIQSSNAVVLPKFPSLYYIFPEVDHDLDGNNDLTGANHSQPSTEPYIADTYVKAINAQFRRISSTLAPGRASFASASFTASPVLPTITPGLLSRYPNGQRVFPIPDYSVKDLVLLPRTPSGIDMGIQTADARSTTNWLLPFLNTPRPFTLNSPTSDDKANFSTNLIMVRNSDSLRPIAIPFLDRVFYQGRQLMTTRTLDIDLGLLRSSSIGQRDTWLPVSGIVYAFREDAVREDGIARPVSSTGVMNAQNPDKTVDPPPLTYSNYKGANVQISRKSVDTYPDPDRRIHGFRLRNGVQLMRNRSFEGTIMDAPKNNRGLSLFTDQPVYIQGDFNLHQTGADDTIGERLEEFRDRLPDSALYNASQFYSRKGRDERFASLNNDRWRPAEVLADSISILSNNFCDGTIADTFVQMNSGVTALTSNTAYPVPDFSVYSSFASPGSSRSYYHQPQRGLFDPGCANTTVTSFHNQNRPAGVNMGNKTANTRNGWDWIRENSRFDTTLPARSSSYNGGYWVDFASPIKISRTGHPVVTRPRENTLDSNPPTNRNFTPIPPMVYNRGFTGGAAPFYDYGDTGNGADDGRQLISSAQTRVNSIIVSGINPSRPNQGYGGLHNFPRFLENWGGVNLNFTGSFIQLSYTNYGTAPFELENLEPSLSPETDDPSTGNQNIPYYSPPQRLWGYDVALQFSPAGPAAARFVTLASNRNEFYVEPPADDPYIANLCKAAVAQIPNVKTNCPERN